MKSVAVLMLALLVIVGSCNEDNESSQVFYYYENGKIYLREDRNLLLIQVDPDDVDTVRAQLAAMPAYTYSGMYNFEFIQMRANPRATSSDRAAVFLFAKQISQVVSVNYGYWYPPDNSQVVPTNVFSVEIKESTSKSDFWKYVDQYDITEQLPRHFIDGIYSFEIPKNGPYSIFEIANRFQESGLCEYSSPSFYSDIRPE